MRIDEHIDETLALCDAATDGPWRFSDILDIDSGGVVTEDSKIVVGSSNKCNNKAHWDNTKFIAHANPQYVRRLCLALQILGEATTKPCDYDQRKDIMARAQRALSGESEGA